MEENLLKICNHRYHIMSETCAFLFYDYGVWIDQISLFSWMHENTQTLGQINSYLKQTTF